MNDFTKEELETIHLYLRGNPRTYELAGKVKSMIDNYCDHIWICRLTHPYGQYPEQVSSEIVCQICGLVNDRYTCNDK